MFELQPHQAAAVERLSAAVSSLNPCPTDDADVQLFDGEDVYDMSDDPLPLTLGHLRDILSIFQESN